MFKKLPFIVCFFLGLTISAQNTYVIEWTFGSNSNAAPPRNADRTIEVGDTVRWEFVESGSHNVVSQAGASESFDSGVVQGPGFIFEHTFTDRPLWPLRPRMHCLWRVVPGCLWPRPAASVDSLPIGSAMHVFFASRYARPEDYTVP